MANNCSHTQCGDDEDLKTLLSRLEGVQFYNIFKENYISIDCLKYISTEHLRNILAKCHNVSGVIFEKKLKEWQDEQTPGNHRIRDSGQNILLGEVAQFSLESILSKTLYGQNVKKFYQKNSMLDTKYRRILSSCITNYLLENTIKPTPKYFEAIAENISIFFPTESKDIYYIHKKGRKPAGCLYSKYHNCLFKLRKEGLWIAPNLVDTVLLEDEEAVDLGDENNVAWLKYNIEPYDEVLIKWENTFPIRRQFMKEKHSLVEIFQEWPLFKQSFGYNLIAADFSKLYPGKENLLFSNWDIFSTSFMKLIETQNKDTLNMDLIEKFKQNKDCQDKQPLILQHLMHSLLKPSTRTCFINTETRKRKFIRSTIADSRDAFLIWAPNISELKSKVKLKIDFIFEKNSTMQPIICGIGNSPFDLSEYFVYFGDVYYKLDNIVKCIDIVFKVFHVLNLKYPDECKNVWLFIQQYFYNITLNNSEKNTVVVTVLNDIQNVKN